MNFTPIDIVFLIIIAFFAVAALLKGFLKEVFGKVSIFGGLIAAFMLMPVLNEYVKKSISNQILSNIVSFLLLFVCIYLALNILQRILSKIFSGEIMKGLDRFLGFVLGAAEGLVVVLVLMAILVNIPFINTAETFKGSFFFEMLGGIVSASTSQFNGITSNV